MNETAVTIKVDGREIKARPGQLLIDACDKAGIYIPHFCYHPRMNPVGMCRMCLVEVDAGRGPDLAVSCTQPVQEGMEVSTKSDAVAKAQDGVLEFLLLNHPLDCPVCDKGGECPLQDQTMAFGPGESRFVEDKRNFEKPIPISSQVFLDRERCILCDRCTRFADEVAGDPLISFQGRGSHTQVNTFPESKFNSYFSGNTVQICPVGALTAKPYRFKARPWDLAEVESTICNPMGDRVIIQASNNQMVRILGMDSDAVNWGWLTDKDRFGFQALKSPNRIIKPQIKKSGQFIEASWNEALSAAADMTLEALNESGPEAIGILGGARLANEDQYAWAKLAKGIWGTDNFDSQLGDGLQPEAVVGLSRTTIGEALKPGSAVIYIGPDAKEELGTLYLRLRHAVTQDDVVLVELTPTATSLSAHTPHSIRVFPGHIIEAAQRLAAKGGSKPDPQSGESEASQYAAAAAAIQDRPLTIIFGRTSLAERDVFATAAAQTLREGFPQARFLPVLRRGNIMGALDMGLAPGLLPGRTSYEQAGEWYKKAWGKIPERPGLSAEAILRACASGKIKTLYLLGADPIGDFADANLAKMLQNSSVNLIVLDMFLTPALAEMADVVLPITGFGERFGTHTNIEGRISVLNQLISPPGTARPDWEIAVSLAELCGANLDIMCLEDIWEELQSFSPFHSGVSYEAVLSASDGVVPEQPKSSMPEMVSGPQKPSSDELIGTGQDRYLHRLTVSRPMYDGATWLRESESMAELSNTESAIMRLHPTELQRLGIEPGSAAEVRHMSSAAKEKGVIEKAPFIFSVEADSSVPPFVAAFDFYNSSGPNQPRVHPGSLIDMNMAVNDILIQPLLAASDDPFVEGS